MKPKMPKLIKIGQVEIEEENNCLSIWIGSEDEVKEVTLVDKKSGEHRVPIRGLNDEFPFWEFSRDGSPTGDVLVVYGDGRGNKRSAHVYPNREGNLKHHNITLRLYNLPFRLKEIRIK